MLKKWRRRARRRWRRIRYSRHYRPVSRILLWGSVTLIGLGAVWLVVTGLLVRSQLSDLESRLGQVRQLVAQGQVDQARQLAKDIPDMARRADRLSSGPAWWTAAQIPYFGDPIEVTRGTTSAAALLSTTAIPDLLTVAEKINPAALRSGGRTIRIGPLAEAAPVLTRAADAIDRSTAEITSLPADTWFSAVDNGHAALTRQLKSIQGYVIAAERVSKALPTMLGADGTTHRYFIGLQNEAEMRGTGGLPGAFAIARVKDGTIKFERFESDSALMPRATGNLVKTGLKLGADYNGLYSGAQPTNLFINSNVSPHFPYAARIWAAMWEKASGEHIDGAVAVDPTALSYFLAATGPAALPGGGFISAANIVSLTQRDNYTLFTDNKARKDFLVSVLKAAANKLLSGVGTPYALVQAASKSASEQRLLVWTADPRTQRLLAQTSYAGAIPTGRRPLSAVVLNNAAAGKLDFYLDRSISYLRTGCGPTRDVTVTIELTNNAPATGLPAYVNTRLDNPPPGVKPGDNHVRLDYYATKGALLQSVSVNGKPATASAGQDLGKEVFGVDVELPRGTTQTIVLHLDEPAGKGTPKIWKQPGVNPLAVKVTNQTCG